jgi:Flp pilus assembly protein TadD
MNAKKNYDEAHRLFRKAVKLDPKDSYWKKQLAAFLKAHPKFGKTQKVRRKPA